MKKSLILAQLFVAACIATPVFAQEVPPTPVPTVPACTDQDKLGIEQCKTACDAAVPQCQDVAKPPVSLEELRAAIAEKCDCTKARNYGQYESCVKKIMGALREFKMIDKATRVAIAGDSKQCRQSIKDRNKGKKKGKK